MPLTEKHRKTLIGENIKLIDCSCSSEISGSKIRKAHHEGKDISKMVSQNTWEIIKDYVNIFNN